MSMKKAIAEGKIGTVVSGYSQFTLWLPYEPGNWRQCKAKAGGGAVEAVVSGKHSLVSLTIAQDAVDPDDVEMLQDMVISAVNEAMRQADEDAAQSMTRMTGGLDLSKFGL